MEVLLELEESIVTDDEEEDGERVQDEEGLRSLESSLSNFQITPTIHTAKQRPQVDAFKCPSSYIENSPQEKLMLAMAENFRQQYSVLYPDRKPLLLCPFNECGVQKFVSTTLRSTLLPYPELYSWEGCAGFISDYLSLELLDPPFEIPKQLSSPTWVLQTQRGTCFDFSCLLCSLLLGAGYNAYCVSGYASKEMCLLDQLHQECPQLQPEIQGNEDQQTPKMKKYSVKPPRDLQSSFEKHQEEKQHVDAKANALKKQIEEEKLQKEQERPPADPLLGVRVYSWVLVLSGSREVPENFFIDPLTGKSYTTTNENFLGIESIWNHKNYWVNMQDCRFGCAELTFDLSDLSKWEYMLCGPSSQSLAIIPEPKETEDDEDEMEEQKVFDMPPSWVAKIDISPKDMEMRYPGGMKGIRYRKAMLEKFAPYFLKDGLVTRLTTYTDLECTQPDTVKEWFQHRSDCLEERELHTATNVTSECFRPGRSDALKYHRNITMVPETERQMDFYSHTRTDGLARRIEKPSEMTETFEDRPDFLFNRHVVYGKRVKVSQSGGALVQRPLQKVEEMFHRDPSRPTSKEVAKRVFKMSEGQIHVTYHLEENRIIPSWLDFIKPKEAAGSEKAQAFTPNMVSGFQNTKEDILKNVGNQTTLAPIDFHCMDTKPQRHFSKYLLLQNKEQVLSNMRVDPSAKPYKNLELYEILVNLMRDEENVVLKIKDSEKEVKAVLSAREQEGKNTELQISIYNTMRNETARQHVEEMERIAKEKQQQQQSKKLDPLAPFLVQMGPSRPLTPQAALQIKTNCLAEFKQQFINKARIIQNRLEKKKVLQETELLQKKQSWYQKNQPTINKDEEDDYQAYCSDALLRIHILKQRLDCYQEKAPKMFLVLEENLKRDPRLSKHL